MIAKIIKALIENELEGLHILKLKGNENVFRVRKGSLRIIYQKEENGEIVLLVVERRNEHTYKNF